MDLDSFYASIEEKRKPEIAGKPVVICVFSGRTADSGAVATANYKARELGIKSGMPIMLARKRANSETVFLAYDIEFYREVSDRIMDLIETECDILEQASIDEAYMDVSLKAGSFENAARIAERIKEIIREQEGLTCSIGIGPNKLIAKMAGKMKKPDGLTIVREREVAAFMEKMPIEKIHGIGKKTAELLNDLDIKTADDLAKSSLLILEQRLGKNKARLMQDKARGIDDSPVEQRVAQQISRMKTLAEDSDDIETIYSTMRAMSPDIRKKIQKKQATFRTVSIITIDSKLETQTRSETISQTDDVELAMAAARSLLSKWLDENKGRKLRRVGIRVSNLEYGRKQKSLGDFL